MKVAFIVNNFPEISETFILSQITGLINRGIDITVVAKGRSNAEVIHEDVFRFNLLEKVIYLNMPSNKFLQIIVALKKLFLLALYQPSCLWPAIKTIRVKNLLPIYLALPLRNGCFDIIHCHYGPNGECAASLKTNKIIDSKLITTFHGYDLSKYLKDKTNVYQYLIREAEVFLPVSAFFKNKLIRLGCPQKRIRVHHMGVNLSMFNTQDRRQKGLQDLPQIITVARLVEKKGIGFAIAAMAELIKKEIKFKYYIIGEGPLISRLKTQTNNLNLNEYISFLGKKTHAQVKKYMMQSDIFLLPSITASDGDQEGIPTSIMEAQAMGLPVIATLHSGNNEIVIDNETGFLVKEREVNEITEKLSLLCKDPQLCSKMGKKGRSIIEDEFNIDKLNNQLARIYKDLDSHQTSE